jgi:hypothetical protein
MQRTHGAPPRALARASAIGLTFLAHAVAISLIYLEHNAPRSTFEPERQYFSIWLAERAVPQREPAEIQEPPDGRRMSAQASRRTEPAPQPDEAAESVRMTVTSQVDWAAEAASVAARIAADAGRTDGFSPKPGIQRRACKPRSFDSQTQQEMAARLPDTPDPDAIGPDPKANCIVVGGYPKCVQKIGRKKRSGRSVDELLKESLAGRGPVSSVPSPDTCD